MSTTTVEVDRGPKLLPTFPPWSSMLSEIKEKALENKCTLKNFEKHLREAREWSKNTLPYGPADARLYIEELSLYKRYVVDGKIESFPSNNPLIAHYNTACEKLELMDTHRVNTAKILAEYSVSIKLMSDAILRQSDTLSLRERDIESKNNELKVKDNQLKAKENDITQLEQSKLDAVTNLGGEVSRQKNQIRQLEDRVSRLEMAAKNKMQLCTNCRTVGHGEGVCAWPCLYCGTSGHTMSLCPNRAKSSEGVKLENGRVVSASKKTIRRNRMVERRKAKKGKEGRARSAKKAIKSKAYEAGKAAAQKMMH